jgi:serine/threonine protein kinase
MADHTGQQLGNYRLIRLLGRGGFAEVYLGQHVRLPSQRAAVKILATRINPEDARAFEREADTIASLTHPHIVRLLDFDVVEGMPFLVMEYAPNGSLRQRHRSGQIVPLPLVVSYVKQVAGGLDYAHYKHLIHRDIKPDNMLLDQCNQILLSDFGVATMAHNTTSQSAQAVIGTVAYMAPEQFQEYPRPASDQYALAVSVYEWLSGTRPFHGTFTEVAVKHALVPPPSLLEKNPALPPAVEEVVFTALAKDPKARYPNVRAFAAALATASQEPTRDSAHFFAAPCLDNLTDPALYQQASAEQLAATIPPRENIEDIPIGTATVPLTLPIQATRPVFTSSEEEEIITPEAEKINLVEQEQALSTSASVQSEQRSAASSGRASRHPLLEHFVRRFAHKAS